MKLFSKTLWHQHYEEARRGSGGVDINMSDLVLLSSGEDMADTLSFCGPLTSSGDEPWRSYRGIIWIGDDPGIRFEIVAASIEDASKLVQKTWGVGHQTSLKDVYPRLR